MVKSVSCKMTCVQHYSWLSTSRSDVITRRRAASVLRRPPLPIVQHRFRRKIPQTTRFHASKCLLGAAKPVVKNLDPFYPQNQQFGGADFRHFFGAKNRSMIKLSQTNDPWSSPEPHKSCIANRQIGVGDSKNVTVLTPYSRVTWFGACTVAACAFSSHWVHGDGLLSNSTFLIFAVLVVWYSNSRPYNVLYIVKFYNNVATDATASLGATRLKWCRDVNVSPKNRFLQRTLAIRPVGALL